MGVVLTMVKNRTLQLDRQADLFGKWKSSFTGHHVLVLIANKIPEGFLFSRLALSLQCFINFRNEDISF